MCDDDDYEELPPISVHSSARRSSEFSMPSAEVLAVERARELQCERELLQLRQEHDIEHVTASTARLVHSDSSGSEGEAALAAAVSALEVRAASAAAAAAARPDALTLLTTLATLLPTPSSSPIHLHLRLLRSSPSTASASLAVTILDAIWAALWGHNEEDVDSEAEELVSVGAWLSAACVWRGDAPHRLRALRALHHVLRRLQSEQQIMSLGIALVSAAWDPRTRLDLIDVLRAAGEEPASPASSASRRRGAAHMLATMLLRAMLRDLLDPETSYEHSFDPITASEVHALVSRSRWKQLSPQSRYCVLQAAGRVLVCEEAGAQGSEGRTKLLTALGQAPTPADKHAPDALKVCVGAAKLQLLFRAHS